MAPSNRLAAVALVAVVLLAGCSAGVDSPSTAATSDQPGGTAAPAAETGTLSFYVSDQPNAIGDFENLTVTVTEIGVHRAAVSDEVDGGESPPTSTEGTSTTGTTTTTTATTATATTGTTTTTTATTTTATTEPTSTDSSGGAGWVNHSVDDVTVDLTQLQGDNATKIADLSLPAAEYNGVYLVVSNVTGNLTTGETADVKLPGDRLRLHKGFALGANNTTTFVFDIAVHETGNGRYVLRPVIGQSGPDVPIHPVGSAQRGGPPQQGVQSLGGAQSGGGSQQGGGGDAPGNDGPRANAKGGGTQGQQPGNGSAAGEPQSTESSG